MNVGDIKQLIRQRCRLDPRLTEAYMLSYAREAVMNISTKRVLKKFYNAPLVDGQRTYTLPQYFLDVDYIEYGSSDDFTANFPVRLVKDADYAIIKEAPQTGGPEVQSLALYFPVDTAKTLRIHYSALLEDILAAVWAVNTTSLDDYMPRAACLSLIIYVAYQHKRNYQKDLLSRFDGEEFENAKLDLEQLYNERVEYP